MPAKTDKSALHLFGKKSLRQWNYLKKKQLLHFFFSEKSTDMIFL